ncbi:hypothetical protein [Halostagnicola kamekurae]|uniref:hypothetical protein n=1 Tax=Halostagnicola kamekurae TaxID=619731 RepID=UPI0011144E64|nr:hypothetical protein [Halostagnicola kamekurae]
MKRHVERVRVSVVNAHLDDVRLTEGEVVAVDHVSAIVLVGPVDVARVNVQTEVATAGQRGDRERSRRTLE